MKTRDPAFSALGHTQEAGRTAPLSVVAILSLVFLGLVLKSAFWFRIPPDHDEFHCLSFVHAFDRGELAQPFQNFHVHFFGWVSAVSANEAIQVLGARSAMLALFVGTCVLLFLLGKHLLGVTAALFAVLCYTCLCYTMTNGGAFRPDGPSVFLSLLALYLFLVRRDSAVLHGAAGVAMAVSCLFTIKAVFFLGAFAALFCVRWLYSDDRLRTVKRLSYFLVAFVLAFFVLYKLHAGTFPPAPAGQGIHSLRRAFSTFMFTRFYPSLDFLVPTLVCEPLTWAFLLIGFGICLHRVRTDKGKTAEKEAVLLCLFVPLLSLAFYRNTGPYFYAFIIPPAMLLCGYGLEVVRAATDKISSRLTTACVFLIAVFVFRTFVVWPFVVENSPEITAAQRNLLSEIHRMFPDPVPYIDGCGMVASYPSAGYFMSSAGMNHYAGQPVLREALATKSPLFLVANVPHLNLHADEPPKSYAGLALPEDEWAALQAYFIHHWGPVWVVGKQFAPVAGEHREEFQILTPGVYTVEGQAEIEIDGKVCHDGELLELTRGCHMIEVRAARGPIRLRWGNRLYRPKDRPKWDTPFKSELG